VVELVPPFLRPLQVPVNATPIQDVCQGRRYCRDLCVIAKTVLIELLVILTQWQKPRINNCMLSAYRCSPTLTMGVAPPHLSWVIACGSDTAYVACSYTLSLPLAPVTVCAYLVLYSFLECPTRLLGPTDEKAVLVLSMAGVPLPPDYEDNQARDFVPTRPPFKIASVFVCGFPRALSRSHVSGFCSKGLLIAGVCAGMSIAIGLIRLNDACLPWDAFDTFTRHAKSISFL
jgi:hypothetical protein